MDKNIQVLFYIARVVEEGNTVKNCYDRIMSDLAEKENIISHVTKVMEWIKAPTLKSISKQSIIHTIARNNNGIYKSKIDNLPLPPLIKKYLKEIVYTPINSATLNRFKLWLEDQNKPGS